MDELPSKISQIIRYLSGAKQSSKISERAFNSTEEGMSPVSDTIPLELAPVS